MVQKLRSVFSKGGALGRPRAQARLAEGQLLLRAKMAHLAMTGFQSLMFSDDKTPR